MTVFNLIYEHKKNNYFLLKQSTIRIKTYFYHDNLVINDFFLHDLIDSNFFITKNSKIINQHDSILNFICKEIEHIRKNYKYLENSKDIEDIKLLINNHNAIFDSIVVIGLERGFKDFGVEGIMRDYAHKLENIDEFEKYKILTLRRHEKDYIIRYEQKYVELFKSKCNLYAYQNKNSDLPQDMKDSIDNLLTNYKIHFEKIVFLDSVLGIKTNSGLTKKIKENRYELEKNIKTLANDADYYINKSNKRLKILYVLITSFIIIISFTSGLIIIRYLTRPITKLTKNIEAFVKSNFTKTDNFVYQTSIKELVVLIENYFSLKKEILSLLIDFQQKVKERTEEVQTQKELIEKQKLKVEAVNKAMISSIKYAKQIQDAILPSNELLKDGFKDYFVIFKPLDIVSGDFLWYKRIKNENYNLKLIAVADCTGHGVPGALMSMLSIAYLNEIVLRKEVAHANEILEILRLNIINNFKYDGLDIAFIIIHNDKNILEFAGANRNVFIKRNAEIIKLKGNKMPIGKYPTNNLFDNQIFEIQKNDVFYAFSDGITDQLSEDGHKFSTKRFVQIIQNNENLKDTKKSLLDETQKWKQKTPQTDDILVFAAQLF